MNAKSIFKFVSSLVAAAFPLCVFAADPLPDGVNLVDLTEPGASRVSTTTTSDWVVSVDHAFDNGTKHDNSDRIIRKGASMDVIYTFDKATVVNAYRISRSNSSVYEPIKRAPKNWTFEGKMRNEETWHLLDLRKDETGWKSLEQRFFSFQNKNAYDAYRINFTSSNGNEYIQLDELEYFYLPQPMESSAIRLAEGVYRVDGVLTCAGTVQLVLSTEGENDRVFELGTCEKGDAVTKVLDGVAEGFSRTAVYTARFVVEDAGFAESVSDALYFGSLKDVTRYVAPDGDDANDGLTPENPMKTVQTAVDALGLAAKGVASTVCLAAGTYLINKPVTLATAVELVGAGTDDKKGTILKNPNYYTYGCDYRLVKLTHRRAAVRNLVVSDGVSGQASGDNGGGAINISAGVVSNCVIRNSFAKLASSAVPKGGGVYIHGVNALVTHCVITNCRISANVNWLDAVSGAGVQIASGRLSNTLVYDCHTAASDAQTEANVIGGIFASGGTVENCTVVGCYGTAYGGVYAENAMASLVNTAAVGNFRRIKKDGVFVDTPQGLFGEMLSYDTCATDDAELPNATCRTASKDSFNNFDNGDFVPAIGGALQNTGKAVDGLPATDLVGCPRQVGVVDIGALEQFAAMTFVLMGKPENYGTPSVAWGTHTDLSGTVTVKMPARYDDPSGEMYAVPSGWRLEVKNGEDWLESAQGEGFSATVTLPGDAMSRLVWSFTRFFRMTLSEGIGGTATGDEWVKECETFEPKIVPNPGWAFAAWSGNVTEEESKSTSFVVTGARQIQALFLPEGASSLVLYVSPNGNDAQDGLTRETAKATVKAAVEQIAPYGALGGKVLVAKGTYKEMSGSKNLRLDGPILVRGETGVPGDVVLDYDGFDGNYFILNDAGASLVNLTITNAHAVGEVQGIGVKIAAAGGVVSNCVVSACVGSGYNMMGGGIYCASAAGLVTHTIVRDCKVGDENIWSGSKAAGIHMVSGRVENCLVVACSTQTATPVDPAQPKSAGGIFLGKGARAVNCTVIGCRGTRTGGILAAEGAAAVNCAVIGCDYPGEKASGAGEKAWAGSAAAFAACATDDETPVNDRCFSGITTAAFRGFDKGDYRPATGGVLVNAGQMVDGLPATDLVGVRRVKGKSVDIGCYEGSPSGLLFIVR